MESPLTHTELACLYQGMHDATLKLLEVRQQWAIEHIGVFDFGIKMGRGRRTYLRSQQDGWSRQSPTVFQVIYGVHCIAEMFDNQQCQQWASHKELTQRDFLDQQDTLTPLTYLSHIVLHEFAHFVQLVLGRRYRGSVHNREFYDILHRSYKSNDHHQVNATILKAVGNHPELIARLQKPLLMAPPKAHRPHKNDHFQHGQAITFKHGGKHYTGTITRLNKRRASIACHDPKFSKALVPYDQLRPYTTSPSSKN